MNIRLVLVFLGLVCAYTPYRDKCKNENIVRVADRINKHEKQYLDRKKDARMKKLRDWISGLKIEGLNVSNINDDVKIGTAFSGGGFRAMIHSAGVVAAMDERIDEGSRLAGLFQASSYISGLSGGSWLIGSLYHNGMPTTLELRDCEDVWNFHIDRMGMSSYLKMPPEKHDNMVNIVNTKVEDEYIHRDDDDDDDDYADITDCTNCDTITVYFSMDYVKYYTEIHREVLGKSNEGFQVSLVDYWGRGLSLVLINETRGGVNMTWSDIPTYDYWKSDEPYPVPIIVADERKYYRTIYSEEPTVVEFTPWEIGSWGYTLGAFTDLRYIGTELYNGRVLKNGGRRMMTGKRDDDEENRCVRGFDNVGYVLATSSAVFNDIFFLYPGQTIFNKSLQAYLLPGKDGKTDWVINGIPHSHPESWSFRPLAKERAFYRPNPFFAFNPNEDNFNITHTRDLFLIDGGVDGQNIPIEPLIQPERDLDVVLAYDFSSDLENFPTAISLRFTALKFRKQEYNISFPYIPRTIRIGNIWSQTVFLGCWDSDYKNKKKEGPVIIYVPNTSYNIESNLPTMQLMFSHEFLSSIMENGWNIATQGNSSDWSICVACGVLLRHFQRNNVKFPPACAECYSEYCYSRVYH